MAMRSKTYTDEFKRGAVRLMRNRGKRTVVQIADDLDVTDGMFGQREHCQMQRATGIA